MQVNQNKMEKQNNCNGSTSKKLFKSDALPTQDLPIDQVRIQSNLTSTSAINHRSSVEDNAIQPAHDQTITTIEESPAHPSTATHISNPELTSEALLNRFSTVLRDYKVPRRENSKMLVDLFECRTVNQSLDSELKLVNEDLEKIISLLDETNERMKSKARKFIRAKKLVKELKMEKFHKNRK